VSKYLAHVVPTENCFEAHMTFSLPSVRLKYCLQFLDHDQTWCTAPSSSERYVTCPGSSLHWGRGGNHVPNTCGLRDDTIHDPWI